MTASDGGNQDPFRLPPGGGPPPPSAPPQQDGPPPPQPPPVAADTRATRVRLTLLTVTAAVTSVLAPPVGVVLGLLTVVLAVRARSLPRAGRVTAGVLGGLAVAVGVAVTVVGLLFRTEITEYSRCLQGANTRLAQQACQDALDEALRERVGLAR